MCLFAIPLKSAHAKSFVDTDTGIEFVWIPGGCYTMGCETGNSDERSVREVCVDGFWMSKYEITNAQFRLFKPDHDSSDYMGFSLDGDTQPAVYVSWIDALNFAAWMTLKNKAVYRLPTEKEWEYAARSGEKGVYPWGDSEYDVCRYANSYDLSCAEKFKFEWKPFNCTDGFVVSAPVGSFRPNKFGLYDMLGNVWEWCDDWYDRDAYKKADPPEEGLKRVLRGGSWYNAPFGLRSANRGRNLPDYRIGSVGFRLVREK